MPASLSATSFLRPTGTRPCLAASWPGWWERSPTDAHPTQSRISSVHRAWSAVPAAADPDHPAGGDRGAALAIAGRGEAQGRRGLCPPGSGGAEDSGYRVSAAGLSDADAGAKKRGGLVAIAVS